MLGDLPIILLRALAITIACSAGGLALAQEFEVASIRPAAQSNRIVVRGGPESPDPERLTYTNVTVKIVMANAYNVESDQISGPGWLETARFDIQAKIPAGATKEQFRVMLANLLTQRFHLAFHREKKDFVVYELRVAKDGPKLQEGAAPAVDAKPEGGRGGLVDAKGFPAPPPHQTAQTQTNGVARMAGNQITMAAFANFLRFPMSFVEGTSGPAVLGTTRVADKTELTGEYHFTVEYEWPGPRPPDADPGDNAATIFNALEQQLGLRLERTKTPLDVLVIDSVDKTPTEN
jgi:uncharacterized protein (TIGR03435 family)